MQTPAFLKPSDLIALAAPSRFCTEEQVQAVSALIEANGFRVKVPAGLFERDGQLAGPDLHRAKLLQSQLDDREVKAVLCMRGGYGAGRILSFPDKSGQILRLKNRENMPWLCGFSDTTALHCAVQHAGWASLHSPVATTLLQAPDAVQQQFFAALQGELSFDFPAKRVPIHRDAGDANTFGTPEIWNHGDAEGPLLGGNLSVLYSLQGTNYFPDLEGAILFIEDLDEMLYHLDRMLLNFELAGVFDRLAGVVIGQMSDMRDNTKAYGFSSDNPFGYDTRAILERAFSKFKGPVLFGFEAGHEAENYTFPLGLDVRLDTAAPPYLSLLNR